MTSETSSIEDIIRLMDLTCLADDADASAIEALCQAALAAPVPVASLCIAPEWISCAKQYLAGKPIPITTVANFPKPHCDTAAITQAVTDCVDAGADEIDIVFPYDQFDPTNTAPTLAWLKAARAACPDHILKIIIESGQAPDLAWIESATACVARSGANFVKTSTGKHFPGANSEAVQCMAYTLHECATPCGLKISGGVRTVEQANDYIQSVSRILGSAFITPQWFRIGASSLLTNCMQQLATDPSNKHDQ